MKILGHLKSGERVFNRHHSHIHGNLLNLIPEGLSKIESKGRNFIEAEVDFQRFIGQTINVTTNKNDEIIYAQRKGRSILSRFVKNRSAQDCQKIFFVLKKTGKQTYVLITAFIGEKPSPEPGDWKYFQKQKNPQMEHKKSVQFWKHHALLWNREEVVSGTETTNEKEFFREE